MNAYILDLRHREVGGAVASGHLYRVESDTDIDWDRHLPEFTSATAGKRLLVLVHGYNNSRSVGRKRLVRFGDLLAKAGSSDVMLSVLWPGDGWAKALTYPFEGRDADDSANALFRWLSTNAAPDSRIAFVGHSLGCRVVMNTAQQISRRGKLTLDRICLMAPAIDNDCLGRIGITCYQDATLAVDRVAVLASEQDVVLRFAYPLGDLAQTILSRERWGKALGRTGPIEREQRIVSRIEPVPKARGARDIDHGDYLDIDPRKQPVQTVAESEKFVLEFLERVPKPHWPAQR
ncbi:alpha/beta fold hydrolase [Pseudomonas monteilii]|uniref:alpha/beta fold hydrolase n=1 Tax=Pseudomonas TaxID=286 RepID=UPI00236367DB|nr:alpha/beta fold hydrolase [Pseudomonas monteilii]MDD2127003.1 alpha/beta fold hydrolase [Pseudomonas monteilii]